MSKILVKNAKKKKISKSLHPYVSEMLNTRQELLTFTSLIRIHMRTRQSINFMCDEHSMEVLIIKFLNF